MVIRIGERWAITAGVDLDPLGLASAHNMSAGVSLLTPRGVVSVGVGRDDFAPLSWKPKAGVSQSRVQRRLGLARLCVTWCGVWASVTAPLEPSSDPWWRP